LHAAEQSAVALAVKSAEHWTPQVAVMFSGSHFAVQPPVATNSQLLEASAPQAPTPASALLETRNAAMASVPTEVIMTKERMVISPGLLH